MSKHTDIILAWGLILGMGAMLMSGCASQRATVISYLPDSPVSVGTGDITVLKVLKVQGSVTFINPFSEAKKAGTP